MQHNLPKFPAISRWDDMALQFAVQKDSLWLNFSGTTPISNFAREVLDQYYEEYAKYGVYGKRFASTTVKNAIFQFLSEWAHAPATCFGMTHNTAEGINLFSHSISLPKDSHILVLENEYPSNVYPWEHFQAKGVGLRFLALGETPEDCTANLKKELESNHISLVSLSPVHWCTGMPLEMDKMCKMIHDSGARLVIDASQGMGNVPTHFEKWDPDLAVFAAWKWLLGPVGLAAVYLSPRLEQGFRILFKGTATVTDDQKYLPYRDTWKEGAEQFEFSTASVNDWVYFYASLELLSSVGISRVLERKEEIVQKMGSMLRELGYVLDKDRYPNHQTSILTLQGHTSKSFSPEAISHFLKTKGIYTTVRWGRVRLAPHIPVTETHIGLLRLALQDYLSQL